ncbi:MAG: cysteine dioxygenase [Alcaligenaceae bacterium]|nr:MAG: cysteine dioxygenase [Alcaligenaceae bacterium]
MAAPQLAAVPTPAGLLDLIAALDTAIQTTPDALPAQVALALTQSLQASDLLTESQQTGSAECYTRHVLHSDFAGRYTLVALIWHPGQRTPAHGHHTWCAYGVLEGNLQEERFGWDDERRIARAEGVVNLSAGQALSAHAGLGKIHRLGNRTDERAISLHVYGVSARQVSTHVNHIVTV